MDGYKARLGVMLMKWVRSSACVTVYNEFIVWAGSEIGRASCRERVSPYV